MKIVKPYKLVAKQGRDSFVKVCGATDVDCEIFDRKRVYDCQSVAQRLRQSESSIREKVFKGQIPYFKAGEGKNAPVRFLGHTLNQWLERINKHKEETHTKSKTTTKKKANRGVKEFENFVENLEQRN